jgi:type IV secretory pathway protease TraF
MIVLAIAGTLAALMVGFGRLVAAPLVYNDSASVPLGFWWRAGGPGTPLRPGMVIGFRPPTAGRAYVAAHMPQYLHDELILKYVVATAGGRICRGPGGTFSVNGLVLGRASNADEHGNPLPTWQGCETLPVGSVAVFSSRIPNSYDSRYYGAVPARDIKAVYRPLWVW